MNRVATVAEIAVAVNTAAPSIPAADRMLGFTARIYTIDRNVVIPAIISVLVVVPCSLSLKNFSIKITPSSDK